MNSTDRASFQHFFRAIILFGFALMILMLTVSGNIVYYIAPQMMPFIYFSISVFFLLGFVQLFRNPEDNNDHCGCSGCGNDHSVSGRPWVKAVIYSIFIVPVLLGFSLPDEALDSSVAENRGIQYSSENVTQPPDEADHTASAGDQEESKEQSKNEDDDLSRAEAYLEDPDGYIDDLSGENADEPSPPEDETFSTEHLEDEDWYDEYYGEVADKLLEKDRIDVNDDNYLDVMTALDLFTEEFKDMPIELKGFGFHEEGLADNQIVSARFAMTCCTADVAVYGTVIESDSADKLAEDDWFKAEGTLDTTDLSGETVPVIKDAKIEPTAEPDTPYVYPSY